MIYEPYVILGFVLLFVLLRPVPVKSTPASFFKDLFGEALEIFWRSGVLIVASWFIFQTRWEFSNLQVLRFVFLFAGAYVIHLIRRKEFEFFVVSAVFSFSAIEASSAGWAGRLMILFFAVLCWGVFYFLIEGLRIRLLTAMPPKPWRGLPILLLSAGYLLVLLAAIQTLSDFSG